jgi:hypothetical protein
MLNYFLDKCCGLFFWNLKICKKPSDTQTAVTKHYLRTLCWQSWPSTPPPPLGPVTASSITGTLDSSGALFITENIETLTTQVQAGHQWNHSYLGGWNLEDRGSRLTLGKKSSRNPHLQINQSKMDWKYEAAEHLLCNCKDLRSNLSPAHPSPTSPRKGRSTLIIMCWEIQV